MLNNAFTIASLFPSILVLFVYFSKQRIKNNENKLYSALIISNVIELILAIVSYGTIMISDSYPLLNEIVSKLLIVSMFTWISLFTAYLYIISEDVSVLKKNKKQCKFLIIVFVIYFITVLIDVFIFPLYYYKAHNVAYSYGPAANLIYFLDGLYVFFWFVCGIKNAKRLNDDEVMLTIVRELEKIGVTVLDQTIFIKNLMIPAGVLGKHKPTEAQLEDVN